MGENHQAVVNYITAIVKTTTKAQGSIQMASYLGAGFGITFTPSAKGKICCKKIYWVQRFVRDGSYYVPWYMTGVGGIDYTSSGPSAVDFPGDTVSGLRDRDYSRTFELSLFCDTQEMYSFVWSYQVKYDSTKNSATVTLDFPF